MRKIKNFTREEDSTTYLFQTGLKTTDTSMEKGTFWEGKKMKIAASSDDARPAWLDLHDEYGTEKKTAD